MIGKHTKWPYVSVSFRYRLTSSYGLNFKKISIGNKEFGFAKDSSKLYSNSWGTRRWDTGAVKLCIIGCSFELDSDIPSDSLTQFAELPDFVGVLEEAQDLLFWILEWSHTIGYLSLRYVLAAKLSNCF